MIITCGQCQARFKVAPEQIKESGSKVRCSNCQHVFTVYRPQPAPPGEREVLGEPRDEALKTRPERPGDGGEDRDGEAGDVYGERPRADSPQERRSRRKQLYSDLEDEPGRATFDDTLDDLFDEEEDSEGPAPHPPLRRAGRAAPAARDHAPDDAFEDAPGLSDAEDGELPPPLEERLQKDDLGLASDPARSASPRREARGEGASIRAAEGSGGNQKLFLILAIVATALLVGLYFMANRPEPLALSVADPAAEAPGAAPPEAGTEVSDPAGTLGISFGNSNQNHYFRENIKEGTILIITGMVRNSYPSPRGFIHLRGRLMAADKSTLADRYAYAGNLLSEEELINLPISEIYSRLSIKGGQNGQNMNVAPGQEVPFMLVFDKLPEGVAEYHIEPMGSSPSE